MRRNTYVDTLSYMKNDEKGFNLASILIVIGIIAFVGMGGYYYSQNTNNNLTENDISSQQVDVGLLDNITPLPIEGKDLFSDLSGVLESNTDIDDKILYYKRLLKALVLIDSRPPSLIASGGNYFTTLKKCPTEGEEINEFARMSYDTMSKSISDLNVEMRQNIGNIEPFEIWIEKNRGELENICTGITKENLIEIEKLTDYAFTYLNNN